MAADDHSTIEHAEYIVSDDDRRQFAEQGFVHLSGVLTEDEVAEDRRRLRPVPAP